MSPKSCPFFDWPGRTWKEVEDHDVGLEGQAPMLEVLPPLEGRVSGARCVDDRPAGQRRLQPGCVGLRRRHPHAEGVRAAEQQDPLLAGALLDRHGWVPVPVLVEPQLRVAPESLRRRRHDVARVRPPQALPIGDEEALLEGSLRVDDPVLAARRPATRDVLVPLDHAKDDAGQPLDEQEPQQGRHQRVRDPPHWTPSSVYISNRSSMSDRSPPIAAISSLSLRSPSQFFSFTKSQARDSK